MQPVVDVDLLYSVTIKIEITLLSTINFTGTNRCLFSTRKYYLYIVDNLTYFGA